MDWVRSLVDEALNSVSAEHLGLDGTSHCDLKPQKLGIVILRIWSFIFSNNGIWPVVQHVADTFKQLADLEETTVISNTNLEVLSSDNSKLT